MGSKRPFLGWLRGGDDAAATPAALAPPVVAAPAPLSGEPYACPDCGAVLRDVSLRACTYCGSALFEATPTSWKRIWHTSDGGLTWSVRERACTKCGAKPTDPDATACQMCGAPLAALASPPDPRPVTAIQVAMPPVPVGPGAVTRRTQNLVRYLENNWWPVPPSVPTAIALLLRILPDTCPGCGSRTFHVTVDASGAWQVLCSGCRTKPGSRGGNTEPPGGTTGS